METYFGDCKFGSVNFKIIVGKKVKRGLEITFQNLGKVVLL